MRFSLTLLISIALFFAGLTITYFSFFLYDDHAQETYRKLMQQADPKSHQLEAQYKASQQHHQVRKEIYFTQNESRLQLLLLSANAELVLESLEGKIEMVEQMQDVNCFMQEKTYYILPDGREVTNDNEFNGKPMQVVRYLKAKKAVYNYSSNNLKAQDVNIYQFVIPGHVLVENTNGLHPIMSGKAEMAQIFFDSEGMHFKAKNVKATFSKEQF